jgi:hypothetical protein
VAEHALQLEAAFAARLGLPGEPPAAFAPSAQTLNGHVHSAPGDEPVTVIGKPVRERDRNHLRFVASQPCLVCGRTPSDAHHIKFAEQRTMGRKVSDRFTVPVCRLHHRELHRRGNERAWWLKQQIDPLSVAARLWATTHAITGADDADEAPCPSRVNGTLNRHGVVPTPRRQIDETNPIVRPEGG